MKALVALILGVGCFQQIASAKAYFQSKQEMIEKAEVIAVITISDVEPAEEKGKVWTYQQKGKATVESVLKGNIADEFQIHGSETFICASCPIKEGRYIAFLKKDGKLWTGSNWHLSLRPIDDDDAAQWHAADDNRYEMKSAPLKTVLAEINAILASLKKEKAGV